MSTGVLPAPRGFLRTRSVVFGRLGIRHINDSLPFASFQAKHYRVERCTLKTKVRKFRRVTALDDSKDSNVLVAQDDATREASKLLPSTAVAGEGRTGTTRSVEDCVLVPRACDGRDPNTTAGSRIERVDPAPRHHQSQTRAMNRK